MDQRYFDPFGEGWCDHDTLLRSCEREIDRAMTLRYTIRRAWKRLTLQPVPPTAGELTLRLCWLHTL